MVNAPTLSRDRHAPNKMLVGKFSAAAPPSRAWNPRLRRIWPLCGLIPLRSRRRPPKDRLETRQRRKAARREVYYQRAVVDLETSQVLHSTVAGLTFLKSFS